MFWMPHDIHCSKECHAHWKKHKSEYAVLSHCWLITKKGKGMCFNYGAQVPWREDFRGSKGINAKNMQACLQKQRLPSHKRSEGLQAFKGDVWRWRWKNHGPKGTISSLVFCWKATSCVVALSPLVAVLNSRLPGCLHNKPISLRKACAGEHIIHNYWWNDIARVTKIAGIATDSSVLFNLKDLVFVNQYCNSHHCVFLRQSTRL